ncbi:3-phosphoshikimate 1-carboxyvinyltransferase [Schaalia vaccimaxillae]|uniref:3-phosphoshikimate 1-carboxyvinyltransferase n=1 Tax=Schaalia vaccimaxillae TaxID=183916 RepID=UPI0003B4DC38|nr:3-phosphoshikimate 1-carboxyvinyltransferase [Schaalia vaccimaxillae]
MTDLWAAPVHSYPLRATVTVPGSKSHTARALYLGAVANAESVIHGALHARDTQLFCRALEQLGASIHRDGDALRVIPMKVPPEHEVAIDCGLAGTVMRFLPPLAALGSRPARFDGDEGARVRPLAPLLDVLTNLGAQVVYEGKKGFLPLTITGPLKVGPGARLEVDASSSSQFLSALLLAAPLLGDAVTVETTGRLVSAPHVEMTARAMRMRGCDVEEIDEGDDLTRCWHVLPGGPHGGEFFIEPDLSNAGPFLAAAMVCGGTVNIPGWPRDTDQAGDSWRNLLADLGAEVTLNDDSLSVTGPGAGNYGGLNIDLSEVGELTPTLVAILALASTPSTITGIGHLRGHETDRLAALATELRRMGGDVDELDDGLVIRPRPLHGADLETYKDHRMATFGAILGLVVPGVRIRDIQTTSKTLPDFESMWMGMLKEGKL